MGLKMTPLFPIYAKYGAKTIDFGGWDLPVHFSGIQNEHEAVRTRAGLFDVSHMGEVLVSGGGALAFLQRVTTNDVSKLQVNQAQYSLMCYPNGGVVDDLLVYKLDDEKYMLVINAANIDKDYEWLALQAAGGVELALQTAGGVELALQAADGVELAQQAAGGVELADISAETALLALQGPLAERILQRLTSADLSALASYHFLPDASVGGVRAIVSRTGYTGEDGFELYVRSDEAVGLWERLLQEGAEEGMLPAGLGARDTLRFEARLPLYGQELSAEITPIEAGVGYFVQLDKGEFIGRDVLAQQKLHGAQRKLVGVEMIDRGIPRGHYHVYVGEKLIGEITTGTQSPTLKTNIGLALIETAYSALNTELFVEIRGKKLRARIVKTPFYKRG